MILIYAALQAVQFVLLLSRQGKVRLSKWYSTYTQKERAKVWKSFIAAQSGTYVQTDAGL